ncbi:MAG TPA: MFS transporter [Ktedonobacteraceae bacterium]|jgi:MFS family permease
MEVTNQPNQPANTAIDAALKAPTTQQPQSTFALININLFWLANQFHWQALLAIVIPSMVARFLDPRFKAINLSTVVTLGTLVAFIVNPLAGAASDYLRLRIGRRRPFMIVGTIINVAVLVLFAFAPSWFPPGMLLVIFTVLFLMLQMSNNLANAPWSAIIADRVPQRQRGIASGFNALFTLLGTAIGAIVAGSIVNGNLPLPAYRNAIVQIFLLIAVVQIIFVTYTVLMVKEQPLSPEHDVPFRIKDFFKRFFFNPMHYPDLSWVLLARFLVTMGIWSVFYFLVYYFKDVIGEHTTRTIILNTPFSGEQFNGVLFQPILLLMALPTSMLGGWLSDRTGRKAIVYFTGIMMTLVAIIFIIFQNQYFALIGGACFGIAYGAYSSVDWALTTDVLPSHEEAGKFMGFWSAMGILPQVLATAVGGVVLQLLQPLPGHVNYTTLFLLTIIYLAIGTIVISKVKGVR